MYGPVLAVPPDVGHAADLSTDPLTSTAGPVHEPSSALLVALNPWPPFHAEPRATNAVPVLRVIVAWVNGPPAARRPIPALSATVRFVPKSSPSVHTAGDGPRLVTTELSRRLRLCTPEEHEPQAIAEPLPAARLPRNADCRNVGLLEARGLISTPPPSPDAVLSNTAVRVIDSVVAAPNRPPPSPWETLPKIALSSIVRFQSETWNAPPASVAVLPDASTFRSTTPPLARNAPP